MKVAMDSKLSISSLAKRISAKVNDEKTISGKGIDEASSVKFLQTCVTLSNIKRDVSKLKVWTEQIEKDGVAEDVYDSYDLKDYEVDPRFKGLILPREIVLNDADYSLLKDVRDHYPLDNKAETHILTAGEFLAYQRKFVNQFKGTLQKTETVDDVVDRKTVSMVKVCLNADGTRVHTDSSTGFTSLPVSLTISDSLFEEDYFDMTASKFVDKFITDFVAQFQS
jgi:hypothetical protein